MFDTGTLAKRFFDITLRLDTDEGEKVVKLEVLPHTVKILKMLDNLRKQDSQTDVDGLVALVSKLMSRNKSGYVLSEELVEAMDFDDIMAIFRAYTEWIRATKATKNY